MCNPIGDPMGVQGYYRRWNKCLDHKHNPESNAIHFGYYPLGEDQTTFDSEAAKLLLNEVVFNHLGLKQEDTGLVLDAGCGIGGTAKHLTDLFPHICVIGTTISQPQVAIAKQRVLRDNNGRSKQRVRIIPGDYNHPQFPNETFDHVYALESACHSYNKPALLKEFYRVLKPGGKLVVADGFLVKPRFELTQEEAELLQMLESGFSVPQLFETRFFDSAPFKSIEVEDITQNILPGLRRSNEKASTSAFANCSNDPVLAGHMNACRVLPQLTETGVTGYLCVTCAK